MSYVVIQDWMLDLGLPMRETMLYALIYGFSQDGESRCYATQEYLCRWLSCTVPTFNKALNALLERDLVTKEQPTPHGKCSYRARYKETLHQCKETLYPEYKETLHQYKETLHNNKIDTQSIDNKRDNTYMTDFTPIKEPKPDYEAEFKELWAIYPKKEGRQRALTAYVAARRKGVAADTIKAGVERYAAQVKAQATPAQYIKQGGNWFAAHRWEDDLLPADAPQAKPKPANRALQYNQRHYTKNELRALGIDFGEDDD